LIIGTVITILILFLWIKFFFPTKNIAITKNELSIAFLVKVVAGFGFIAVYFDYYSRGSLTVDSTIFLAQSKTLAEVFYKSPLDYFKLLTGIGENEYLIQKYLSTTLHWSAGEMTVLNDSKNVLKINSVIYFISQGNEYVHTTIIAFFSFIGIINIYKTFEPFIHFSKRVFFWILLLIPSTLFWTSGILKEPFLFIGISFFIRSILYKESKIKSICFGLIGLILMIGFKPYVLLCILPALIFYLLAKYFFKYNWIWSSLSLLILTVIFFSFSKPRDTITHYLSRKQFDFINIGKGGLHAAADTCIYYFQPEQYKYLQIKDSTVELKQKTNAYIIHFGGIEKPIPVTLTPKGEKWIVIYKGVSGASFIPATYINNSFKQLLINIPEALANSILRPYPNDPGRNLKYPAMLEVWLFIIAILFTFILNFRKPNQKELILILSILIFCLLLSMIIGWTTPVLGAIARYRFPVYLGFALILLILNKKRGHS
jgi:hypothetical protein